MNRSLGTKGLALICTLLVWGCGDRRENIPTEAERIPAVNEARASLYDSSFPWLLQKHGVVTAGVGVIKNGALVWTGYYGEQRPGVPASARTQFDVASITKTVAAETLLRLAAKGRIDLDEPMSAHWLAEDIAADPRAQMITPRMALNHSTGFPNWRFLDEANDWRFNADLPLRFLFEPGTSYGYSGEGFEYLARFTQNKLGTDFEQLVMEEIFHPLGMTNVSFSCREANFPNIVRAIDAGGNFNGHYCRPGGFCRAEGEWSAADDMRVSVPDHAKFLISVMNAEGYGEAMARERNRVQVEKWNEPDSILVLCKYLPPELCPQKQGYGLGWEVADYGNYQLVSHFGSDFSELALAYFYTDSKDGILIFLNAPNERAVAMMPEAIELIHPDSPVIPHFNHW